MTIDTLAYTKHLEQRLVAAIHASQIRSLMVIAAMLSLFVVIVKLV